MKSKKFFFFQPSALKIWMATKSFPQIFTEKKIPRKNLKFDFQEKPLGVFSACLYNFGTY